MTGLVSEDEYKAMLYERDQYILRIKAAIMKVFSYNRSTASTYLGLSERLLNDDVVDEVTAFEFEAMARGLQEANENLRRIITTDVDKRIFK